MTEHLPNHPLKEAVFEMHWVSNDVAPQIGTHPEKRIMGPTAVAGRIVDPNYKFFLARIYDHLKSQYPVVVNLQTAQLPEEYSPHTVQHQFWKGNQEWPVIQVGPGVLTVNEGTRYEREDFFSRVNSTIDLFSKVHPSLEEVRIDKTVLRYNNFIGMDFHKNNLLEFLGDKMHTEMRLPESIFENIFIERLPESLMFRNSFRTVSPSGIITISLTTAMTFQGEAGLMWELQLNSSGTDVPDTANVNVWMRDGHAIIDHCFLAMIKGELEEVFRHE